MDSKALAELTYEIIKISADAAFDKMLDKESPATGKNGRALYEAMSESGQKSFRGTYVMGYTEGMIEALSTMAKVD